MKSHRGHFTGSNAFNPVSFSSSGSIPDRFRIFFRDISPGQVHVIGRHIRGRGPPEHVPHLGLRIALSGAVGSPGMAERMGINAVLQDTGPVRQGLEQALDRPDLQGFRSEPVPLECDPERRVRLFPERMNIKPVLDIGDAVGQGIDALPGLPPDFRRYLLAVELQVPDTNVHGLRDPGTGIPEEHQQGPIAGRLGSAHQF